MFNFIPISETLLKETLRQSSARQLPIIVLPFIVASDEYKSIAVFGDFTVPNYRTVKALFGQF